MPTVPTTKNAELQGQSILVRTVAATLEIKVPADKEKPFRATLLRRVTAELAAMPTGLIVRLYESACGTDYPDEDVVAFRLACASALAKTLNLAAYKAAAQTSTPAATKP